MEIEMVRKSFHTSQAGELIEFEVDDEVFHSRPKIPAGILMRFATAGKDSEGENIILVVRDFFKAALIKGDRERFFALLDDPDRFIDIELLVEIASYLAEKVSGRPTGQPSSSTSLETKPGGNSMDGHGSEVTTYSRTLTLAEHSAL
jgi:hypothetical protein